LFLLDSLKVMIWKGNDSEKRFVRLLGFGKGGCFCWWRRWLFVLLSGV